MLNSIVQVRFADGMECHPKLYQRYTSGEGENIYIFYYPNNNRDNCKESEIVKVISDPI